MDRRTWMIVGIIAVVAVVTGFLLKRKSESTASDSNSQLPAEQAAANYSVPPDIGTSVDNTGGANFPQGESGFMYTMGQAQSLPSNGTGQ